MQSIVKELAQRLDLPPSQVESAIGDLLIRVRAALETIGEAEIGGLGIFRSIDGKITFQPAASFAEAVNREFAGMRPVALTSTGESVDVDDERAIPGSDASFEEPIVTRTVEEELAEASTPDWGEELANEDTESVEAALDEALEPDELAMTADDAVEESEPVAESSFESPPPPIPSKVRIPPGEKREFRDRRRKSSSVSKSGSSDDFPDMGPVVSTRPVEPIRAAAPAKRRRNPMPAAIVAVVVVVALLSWLVIGGDDGDSRPSTQSNSTAAVSAQPEQRSEETPPAPVPEKTSSAAAAQRSMAESVTAAMQEVAKSEPEVARSEPAVVQDAEQSPAVEVIDLPRQQPAAGEAASQVATQATGSTFAWIVGSYPSRSEADARVETLRAAGFDAQVYEATVKGRAAFRVGVGRFDSEASALNGRNAVPAEITDAWITRVN